MIEGGEARVRLDLINDRPDQMVEMVPMTPMQPLQPAAPAEQGAFLGDPQPAAPSATAQAEAPAKPAATATSTLSTPKAASGQGKMIQVLASGSQPRAEAMGKVMTQRYGVPYQVVAHDAIFRVLLGPVAADQQASLLEQIRQGGLEQAFIVP
ncbi:rare lipoprotein A [compost metagenome]